MSCPYLEKGKTAYCHAFGEQKLAVESPEFSESCFSGEFGECPFLFLPPLVPLARNKGQRNFLPVSFESLSRWHRASIKGAAIG
jgi:hypothetical protein